VEFKLSDNDLDKCSSRVGMKQSKGSQTIKVDPGCGATTLVHETLHAAGFWHEQSRPDRDQYVEILSENIIFGQEHNFWKKSSGRSRMIGQYNFSSVMHYWPFSFGKDCIRLGSGTDQTSDCTLLGGGDSAARTIRIKTPGAVIQRDATLGSDRNAINEIYRNQISEVDGREWGNGHYATAVAVGDVDGDGLGEIVVGRFANSNSRLYVLDDMSTQQALIATGPSNWGAGIGVTDVAVGDVDGDGRMEIGVTRNSSSGNRWYIYRYNNGRLDEIASGGDDWGNGIYATSIAFGDADGDGRDEFAVGRRAGQFGRYYLFDDGVASRPFERMAIGGSEWDATHYTTALDFGDMDNDGREELGIARYARSGMRYEIVAYSAGQFQQRVADGHDWDSTHYATSIALGNIDNDPVGEFVVGRKAASSSRFHVFDDVGNNYSLIDSGGDDWGSNYYTVSVGLADVDADGRDEVLVARNAGTNGRYYVFDWISGGFSPVSIAGAQLLDGNGATDIAAGDLGSNGTADLVISYDEADMGGRRYEVLYMAK